MLYCGGNFRACPSITRILKFDMHRHIFIYYKASNESCVVQTRDGFSGTPLADRPDAAPLEVDVGIAVHDWDDFKMLKSALVEEDGFELHPRMVQRLMYPPTPSVVIDLIPFGGVENSDRTIAWPPETPSCASP